ncbi:MAG: HAD family phosphatase [Gemmatimonadales bacterium]|nr:HAD family phosphatase [Gemmatimonadota bacterium]MBK9068873.1 HAD family phosphatase [Gemmatimonadota bacterium]MBP6668068.1 HAD family phosphatase [Gemmatimonadales bacterium]MBP9201761.1 HAD family phosphatase [Gemmatimonadales bacterium]
MTGPSFAFLIFDLDGVLLDFHPERRLARLATMTGLAPAFLQAAIWDADFERAAEAGAWPTGAAYLAEFNARIGMTVSREQWIAARREAMTPRAAVIGYLRRLKERVPLALLTNNGALLLEALPQLCGDVTDLFGDRLHASFQFGARKPDPAVYQRLLARHGVPPSAALMVDDDARNVAGAVAAGLAGYRYEGLDALAAFLEPRLPPRQG